MNELAIGRSIFSKLSSPLAAAGASAIVICGVLLYYHFQMLSVRFLEERTLNLSDSLTLAIQSNLTSEQKNKFIAPLLDRNHIERVILIDTDTNNIIYSNVTSHIGQNTNQVLDSETLNQLNTPINNASSDIQITNASTVIHSFDTLISPNNTPNQLKSFTLIITHEQNRLNRLIWQEVGIFISAMLLTITVMIITMFHYQRRKIIEPLQRISGSLQREEATIPLEQSTDELDELGLLIHSYNRLSYNRHKKEQAIKDSKRYLDAITDATPVLLAYLDADTRILFANSQFCWLFGIKQEDCIGLAFMELFSDKENELIQPQLTEALSSTPVEFELVRPPIDTHQNLPANIDMYFSCTVTPTTDETESLVGLVVSLKDISGEREIQNILQFEKESAEKMARYKSEFLATMSHEIRTPMNGIMGMLNMLAKSLLTPQQKHQLNMANSSAKTLLGIINDILDFSKIEAGKFSLEYIEFDLLEMVDHFVQLNARHAHHKGVSLNLDTTGLTTKNALGDPTCILQILNNLVSNALKFTSEGEITVSLTWAPPIESSHATFYSAVRDTGIGISPEKLDTLFDSYTQAESSTTREYCGSGLGLTIVKNICQLMQGKIGVTSETEKGSCFEFEIVLGVPETCYAVTPKEKHSDPAIYIGPKTTHGKLIVDNLSLFSAQVESYPDIDRYLEHATHSCNIILLDHSVVPDPTLIQAQRLRSNELNADAILVLLSDNDDPETLEEAYQASINIVIAKPCTILDIEQIWHYAPKKDQEDIICRTLLRYENESQQNAKKTKDDEATFNCRVLLAEDNHINQMIAIDLLEEMGLIAEVVDNGKMAIDALKSAGEHNRYDLVLMDCMMPIMDGFTATQAIREGHAGEENTEIPIIAMTTNAMAGDREKCLDVGMNDYMSKPIDPQVAEKKIKSWLSYVNTNNAHKLDDSQ